MCALYAHSYLRFFFPGCFGKDAAAKAASPAQWAERAMPFLMGLTKEQNGQSLTCPGAPATHQDRTKITDKPIWACGFNAA